MITKLKLTNFRQHHDTIIEFVPGVNTIVGANAAGKSTIPEAIEFALFGAKALRDTGNSWITDGKSSGSVVLSFDDYKVGRDAVAAKVYKDNELVADYKANVTKYVTQITGVTHAGFRLGHYVRQKELAAFSALRPGKRQETIEKMLKIHAIDKVLSRLKGDIDSLDSKLKGLLAAAQDADRLSDELATAQIERAGLVPIEINEEPVNSLRKQIEDTRVKATKLESLKKELARLDLQPIIGYEESKEAFESFVVKDFGDFLTRLEDLKKREILSAKMSFIKSELEKGLRVINKPIAPEKPEWAYTAISVAESNLSTVRKLRGLTVCPTCLTEIADVDELIKSLEESLGHAKTSGQPAIDAYTTNHTEFLLLNESYSTYIAELGRRNELKAKFIEVEFSAEEKLLVETEIDAIRLNQSKYKELKHSYELLKQKIEIVNTNKLRAMDINKEYDEQLLQSIYNDISSTTLELQQKAKELKERKDLAMSILTNIAKLDGRIQELRKAVENANDIRQLIDNVSSQLAELKHYYEVYVKFKKYLTAKIRPMIATVAETLFHKVTKNRYSSFQLGSDYEIIINTHQGFVRKLTTISGSENDLANLCLRLAIATLRSNKLVGSLGFIILDEISSSFDDNRTKQTLEGLLELKDIIPQIINITHKPVEMHYADKLITVQELNGKASVY